MTQLANSLVASSDRPLRLRMRPDLEVTRQHYQGRDYWVVKDPLSLNYFRFEDEEYYLLRQLDGNTTAADIKRGFESHFAPQKLTYSELFQFAGMLYRQSLLLSAAPGQGAQLLRRSAKRRGEQARRSLASILAIRIRGFDPEWLLNPLARGLGWFYSAPAIVFNLLLILSAICLVFTQFEVFQSKLPGLQTFFSAGNWFWLAVVLAGTKVIHELGHGIACRRLGGQCHEMGLMFLVLMPCLYCNVSDSWMLPNKWKRMAIAAAGMYTEFVLAAGCTFVWWFSHPGLIHQLALNIMFVSSVSTLLFNANPLLRFDGYYILADWLEVPNLRQKASRVIHRFLANACLGLPAPPDPFMPRRHRLAFGIYSIAAAAYRWFITLTIFWFLYHLLEPYGLKVVSQLLALMALYSLVGMPLLQLYRFLTVPGRIYAVKPIRVAVTAGIVLILLGAILLIPTPHRITCSYYVQPSERNRVYVEVPGILEEILVEPGAVVAQGDPIARLASIDQSLRASQLRGDARQAKTRWERARWRASRDDEAAKEVGTAYAVYQTLQDQWQQQQKRLQKLVIRSPASGTFVFPPPRQRSKDDAGHLSTWEGIPLEQCNLHAFLDQGTVLGEVIPEMGNLEAILVLHETDVEFVRGDQQVDLWSRQDPTRLYRANIDQIAPAEMKTVPKVLDANYGGPILTQPRPGGGARPKATLYQVSVPFERATRWIRPGSTGMARIRVGHTTLGQRAWRFLCRTFRFEL